MKKDYVVKVAGFFYGTYYPAGKVLKLHPKQAYYEVLLGNLELRKPVAAAAATAPAKAEVPRMAARAPAVRRGRRRRVSETATTA